MQLDFDYKKLRLAQDLNKSTLEQIAFRLMKESNSGLYEKPNVEEIAVFLNDLARSRKIKHYRLSGEHGEVILFDKDDVLLDMEVFEVKSDFGKGIIKVQCYDQKVEHGDKVPYEISSIKDLYRIPKTTFESGSCIYFLCLEGDVVYVGQAENVHSRLVEHKKNKLFDDVFYIRVGAHRMDKVEKSLIAFLQPKYNKQTFQLNNQRAGIAKGILKSSSP